MLRSSGFSALLEKMAPVVKRLSKDGAETVTKTMLRFKVTINGDTQYFLKSFQDKTLISNVQSLFDTPIAWDRIRLNLRDYMETDFVVTLEDVEFDSKLLQIDVSKKIKNGIDKFVYIITLEKEEDAKIDSIMANQYYKQFVKDANDKSVPAEFTVTMVKSEPKKDVSSNDM